MWGYLMSFILGPVTEHNGVRARFFQYFAGIVAHPQWYTLRREELNSDPSHPMIDIALLGESFFRLEWDAHAGNLEEDDVLRHLAYNGVTQSMIDTAYPYGVTFLDFELSSGSANSEYYSFIDEEHHRLLGVYGMPTIPGEYAGWWTPKHLAPARRACLTDEIKSEHFHNTGSGPSRPPNHWYHLGEHYVYIWLTERPPPGNEVTAPSSHLSQYEDEDCPLHDDPLPEYSSARVLDYDVIMKGMDEGEAANTGEGPVAVLPEDDGFASVHDL
ncbi:hypothetical protein EV421DRAFT_1744348 [Armillaria borealis]|uniref:Uncharacterized protein n=1 Tax=Armillaria borealis TaxID=47425 RepID=A0AA39MDV7_9AGAR|nr:hypothetical protein EV421DRAFT_1744348 [Armillaria borealis]